MYRVRIGTAVQKQLKRLPKEDGDRISLAVMRLGENPRPAGCLTMSGYRDLYRIRIGKYRAIYGIYDKELVVLVVRVAKRGEDTYDL